MLQRLLPYDDEQCDGAWSRLELEAMNNAFVRAVSRAFSSGHESPVAASATVRIGGRLNGSRQLEVAAAIGGVWKWFVDAKFEATAVEVLARVRAVCADVPAEQVRDEFKKRLWRSTSINAT